MKEILWLWGSIKVMKEVQRLEGRIRLGRKYKRYVGSTQCQYVDTRQVVKEIFLTLEENIKVMKESLWLSMIQKYQ